MTISAKVILDSISPDGLRLTTLQLRYPRFIHAEFLTHRVFSRNSSSSRAIPVERLIQDVIDDPAMPIHWGKNQKGMQAEEELEGLDLALAKSAWQNACDDAVRHAHALRIRGAHKQIVNRILEPFAHISTVVTATEFSNFFDLRLHKDAQPEIQLLAQHMWGAMVQTDPQFLHHGEWHLPYITEQDDAPLHELKKASAARCARVSYLTHEGKTPNLDADLALYDRLITSEPAHASPVEHIATPDVATKNGWENPHLHGNFRGWQQWRKVLQL